MKTKLTALACSCFTLSLAVVAEAKDWRGITPLQSTRADVERLLGEPPPPPKNGTRSYVLDHTRSIYFLEEGQVYIVFAEKEVSQAVDCLGKIGAGTVLMIELTPKNGLTLGDLQLDEKELRKFNPSQPPEPDFEGFIHETEGLVIRTFKGKVEKINYIAAAKDKHLCPTYYENPESFVNILLCGLGVSRKFDEYGDIPFNDEKARLDNIAIELQNDPGTELYIIGYAGRKARVGEARAKAERAKNYLNLQRRLDAGRVIVINGGYREELTLEHYIVRVGTQPPTSSPTVDPSEVEIIPEDEKPPRRPAKPLR